MDLHKEKNNHSKEKNFEEPAFFVNSFGRIIFENKNNDSENLEVSNYDSQQINEEKIDYNKLNKYDKKHDNNDDSDVVYSY
ncbi:MAG: hypothetical protein OEZ01_06030 [Candidatus Heimdallarchaeota archaeon]|nr:hypothetical protein [Candidatus Heimdallarchaeota archaeon]MDH5645545.1 hypothetical protein [Candidatus Heimdallarchaeota archaeon]